MMMMLKNNLFIILTTFASIWDVSLEYPASNSKSTSNSSDQLIYTQPGISQYFDDSASSALLTLPFSEKLNPTPDVQVVQNINEPIVKQPRKKDIINKKRAKRFFTPSHRANLSTAWTEERKKKQSKLSRERMIGKIRSEEANMKVSKALTGRILSQSTREKFRLAQIGKRKSESTKQKISDSLKCLYEERRQQQQQQQQQQPKDL